MKYLFLLLTLLFVGCAQLMNGQQQPVIQKSVKEKIFFTTCSGAVEDWGSCNKKAQSTCASEFTVIRRFENAVGGRRELTFQCK